MDWVARELPAHAPKGSVWLEFSGPATGSGWGAAKFRQRQELARRLLAEALEHGNPALGTYLREALQLTPDEVEAVLWDPPRALMTAVIPTILRRLETSWRRVPAHPAEPAGDYQARDHPLPDFVPQQLFGDLNLPEVEIVTGAELGRQESFFLPIVQALKTLAPGRVTRRFGYQHADSYHWMPPPDVESPRQELIIEDYCAEFEESGLFQTSDGATVENVRCVRPWKFHLQRPPGKVAVASNAHLEWRSQLAPAREDERLALAPPRGSPWAALVKELRFYLHHDRNHVLVRRFASAARANLAFRDGTTADLQIRFVSREDHGPAAVGFTQESDGIAVRFQLPADLGLSKPANRHRLRAFRAAWFRQCVHEDADLGSRTNSFQREWLSQVYLSALGAAALREGLSAEAADARLAREFPEAMAEVLKVIFQAITLPDGEQVQQRVHDRLLVLCRDSEVTQILRGLATVLWKPLDDAALHWARRRCAAALGGAMLEACQQSYPRLAAGDLYLDLDAGPRPLGLPPAPAGVHELWITEATLGGGGIVEEVLRSGAAAPEQFFELATNALAPTDFEVVARELRRLLRLTATDGELNARLDSVRTAADHRALDQAAGALRECLRQRGLTVNHAILSALHSRVLRPGSSAQTDALLRKLLELWTALEDSTGVSLDPRAFAYVATCSQAIQERFAALGPSHDPYWRFQAIRGLLWPRGQEVERQGLASHNPFAEEPAPDRETMLELLQVKEGA